MDKTKEKEILCLNNSLLFKEAHNHKDSYMPGTSSSTLKKTTMGSAILMDVTLGMGLNRRCLPGRETLIFDKRQGLTVRCDFNGP